MKPDKTLNIKGEVCPYTFVKSKLAIEDLKPGQILEVIVDHLPAVENVPRSMENEGHEILEVEQLNDRDWRILVKKA
ncbi:MAG: sulfurtransferase TusA family protein [Candidatus Altiarchaeota archaeon]